MRFSLVLALSLAALTMTAAAQKHQKPKSKPSYTAEKEAKGGGGRNVKAVPAAKSSSAQELRRVEQSSAKAQGSHKADSSKRSAPALKGQKKETNPPIRLSGGGGKGSKSGKGADPNKGRLRHKGSHK